MIDEPEEITRKKYEWLTKNHARYGSGFHGRGYIPFLRSLNHNSIIDIGTGHGEMCRGLSPYYKEVYGLDWVIEPLPEIKAIKNITFLKSEAWRIPLPDKSVDILTSFDFFEHVLTSKVEAVLTEMTRVTRVGMLHKICFDKKSGSRRAQLEQEFGDGELHLTARNINEYWKPLFKNKFSIDKNRTEPGMYKVNGALYIII